MDDKNDTQASVDADTSDNGEAEGIPPTAAGESPVISMENRYYAQMDSMEQLRAQAALAQYEYDRIRVQLEFSERTLASMRSGRMRDKAEAIKAIIGTPSMGWVNYTPAEPYPDSCKPEYRHSKPRKGEVWHRLACAVMMAAPIASALGLVMEKFSWVQDLDLDGVADTAAAITSVATTLLT